MSFYRSRINLDRPNYFAWVQIALVRSKLFWSGPNCFGQVQIILVRFIFFSGRIFMIWTCPKHFILNQNYLDGPNSFWTHRRTKHTSSDKYFQSQAFNFCPFHKYWAIWTKFERNAKVTKVTKLWLTGQEVSTYQFGAWVYLLNKFAFIEFWIIKGTSIY